MHLICASELPVGVPAGDIREANPTRDKNENPGQIDFVNLGQTSGSPMTGVFFPKVYKPSTL